MRYITGLVILIAASMACSKGNDRIVAGSPTSPTSATAETTIAYVGGVSGPMDVLFPPRNESFVFRNDLEAKYATGLSRAAQGTFVDREGEIVWLQEYIRYRVNGCDHATAMARVLAQIAGGAAGGICSAPPEGVVLFPPRNEVFDARRTLETTYQLMGRGLSGTSVDPEGSSIWTTEYLRYRTNACDHATAERNVFSQIDGGPVPPTCQAACSYVLNPAGLNTSWTSSTQGFEVRPASTTSLLCTWTAASTVPWLTFAGHRLHAVHLQHRAKQRRRPHRVHRLRVAGWRRALPGQSGGDPVCVVVHDGGSVPLIGRDDGVPLPERGDAVQFHRELKPAWWRRRHL